MKRSPFWLLFNIYGWVILVMSLVTAFVVGFWWISLFGVIGYQVILLVELMWGGALGRTGRVRLARAEQENRELRDEKARLVGTIQELEGKPGGIQELPSQTGTATELELGEDSEQGEGSVAEKDT